MKLGPWNVDTIKEVEQLIWEKDTGKKWKKRIKEWKEEEQRRWEETT